MTRQSSSSGASLPQFRSPRGWYQDGVLSDHDGISTAASARSCTGTPTARYQAWRQARGDHGTGRDAVSRGGARVAMPPTVGDRAAPAHPARFTIAGGAGLTPD